MFRIFTLPFASIARFPLDAEAIALAKILSSSTACSMFGAMSSSKVQQQVEAWNGSRKCPQQQRNIGYA